MTAREHPEPRSPDEPLAGLSWVVEYMQYQSPGRYEADSFTEAIDQAMHAIDEGRYAPTAILGPDGAVVIDKPSLSSIYSKDWGAIPTEQIAARYPDQRLAEAAGALRDLLATPCDCGPSWTERGRHASDCRWRFIHDFLDDDEIALIAAALAVTRPVAANYNATRSPAVVRATLGPIAQEDVDDYYGGIPPAGREVL